MASRLAAAERQGLRDAEEARRLYRQLQRAIHHSLLGLANALEIKDACRRGHSERVGAWSRRLAAALGLTAGEVDMVTQAGLLHDIGTIGVPETVLRKGDRFDHAEWTLMRNHPVVGAQILAPFDFFAGGALVIRHHHERWDGSGYPDGLVGSAIPLGARLVGVVDVFEALISDRPYRAALPREAALAHLADEAGRTLDPDVVAVFLELAHPAATP